MKAMAGYALAAVVALGAALPEPTVGQGVTVSPMIGGYTPAGSFHELRDVAGDQLERGSSLALGLNVGLGALRGSLAYATGAQISRDGISGRDNVGDGSVLAGTVDLVLRPLPRLIVVQPYLLGGVGYKRETYSFDEQSLDGLRDGNNDFILHAGLGVDISVGALGLVAEFSDFIGKNNEGDWKVHDGFGMVGLKFRLF